MTDKPRSTLPWRGSREPPEKQQAAIEELIRLGAVTSYKLVGDLGEQLAADYYGVTLDHEGRLGQGYDLIRTDGKRVEVKTLRDSIKSPRTLIGPLTGSYDVLFAVRIAQDYTPVEAIEAPRQVVEEYYPGGVRVSWTKKLADDERVKNISARELLKQTR